MELAPLKKPRYGQQGKHPAQGSPLGHVAPGDRWRGNADGMADGTGLSSWSLPPCSGPWPAQGSSPGLFVQHNGGDSPVGPSWRGWETAPELEGDSQHARSPPPTGPGPRCSGRCLCSNKLPGSSAAAPRVGATILSIFSAGAALRERVGARGWEGSSQKRKRAPWQGLHS